MVRSIALSTSLSLLLALTGCRGDPSSPEYWDKALNSAHHTKDRVRVLDDLREAGKAKATFLPMLHNHLAQDKQSEVRGAIARVLGDLKDPSSVGPLTDAIEMGSTDSAGNAMDKEIVAALGKIGDPKSIPTLLRLLKSRDNYVRIEAINALGSLRAKEAVEPLTDIVLDEQGEPFIGKKAIEALGNIGDPKAVPALVKMMFKERRGVSWYAESSFSLFQVGAPAAEALLALLRGGDKGTLNWLKENGISEWAIYAKSAQVLADLHDPRGEDAFMKQLAFKNEDPRWQLLVRMKAADALGRLHVKAAVKPLGGMLEETEPNARDEYVQAIIRIGGRDAVPALVKSASKGGWDARERSIIGLSMVGDGRDIAAMDAIEKGEPKMVAQDCKEEPDVQGCAGGGASIIKERVDAIHGYAKRLAAAKECGEDTGCWTKKLDDSDPGVRQRAAIEMGRSGKGDALAELLKHLKEQDLSARSAVILTADWLVMQNKSAAKAAAASLPAIDKQLDEEHGKTDFVKVDEDLKRLAVDLKRA